MRFLLLIPFILVGCRTAPTPAILPQPKTALPAPTPATAAPPVLVAPTTAALEQKIRQQAQVIEALISQIDALTAKLAAGSEANIPPVTAPIAPTMPTVTPVATPPTAPIIAAPTAIAPPSRVPDSEPILTPNAAGVIDLIATSAPKAGESVNPFTVRATPSDRVREVTLRVGGIVAGPTTCAVVNDRLMQSGDTIESLAVERIDSDAVFLRGEGQRMRVPVSAQPVRVRMPL